MNSEREKADILFDYGLPLQFCCHLIQFYTLLFLRVATLNMLKKKNLWWVLVINRLLWVLLKSPLNCFAGNHPNFEKFSTTKNTHLWCPWEFYHIQFDLSYPASLYPNLSIIRTRSRRDFFCFLYNNYGEKGDFKLNQNSYTNSHELHIIPNIINIHSHQIFF